MINNKENPCWTCMRAGSKCSWSKYRMPVKGWIAEKTNIQRNITEMLDCSDSYKIEYCPLYIQDKFIEVSINKISELSNMSTKVIRNHIDKDDKKFIKHLKRTIFVNTNEKYELYFYRGNESKRTYWLKDLTNKIDIEDDLKYEN